jgi:hypothetical protein
MRVPFQLKDFQPMSFSVAGKTYVYTEGKRLAVKPNLAANIEESVLEMPDGKIVWLTVVGHDDESAATGITRGWYVTQTLDAESAATLVKAFAVWS